MVFPSRARGALLVSSIRNLRRLISAGPGTWTQITRATDEPLYRHARRPHWGANCCCASSIDSLICSGNTVQNGSFIRNVHRAQEILTGCGAYLRRVFAEAGRESVWGWGCYPSAGQGTGRAERGPSARSPALGVGARGNSAKFVKQVKIDHSCYMGLGHHLSDEKSLHDNKFCR